MTANITSHFVDAFRYATMAAAQDLTGFQPFKKHHDKLLARMGWSWRMTLDADFPFTDFRYDIIFADMTLAVSFTFKGERVYMYDPHDEFPSDALAVGLGMLSGPLDVIRERNTPKSRPKMFPGRPTGFGPKRRGSL